MEYYVWSFGPKLPFENNCLLPGSVRVENHFNLCALLLTTFVKKTGCVSHSCLKGNVSRLCFEAFHSFSQLLHD